jgi:hypothetical protein
MNDLMVDIETLGTGRDAAIISIGAVRFDREAKDLSNRLTFYETIKFQNGIGTIEPGTVLWWMQQGREAREAIFSLGAQDDALPLNEALTKFAKFAEGVDRLWSNGPMFDERLLREAAERKGSRLSVGYRESRCCRTYFDLARTLWPKMPSSLERIPEGRLRELAQLSHHALGDALKQAADIQAIHNRLMEVE